MGRIQWVPVSYAPGVVPGAGCLVMKVAMESWARRICSKTIAVTKQTITGRGRWARPGVPVAIIMLVLQSAGTAARAEDGICKRVIGSQCDASQERMLDALLKDMNVYGYVKRKIENDQVPAFELLPKDRFGLVNWTKAEADGLISPRSSIDGVTEPEDKPKEGFFENIILLQTAVHFMPDVLFPHGLHSNMISCESCHPKPFKKKNGANNIRMTEIFEGKWCGKCHGKVSFPVHKFSNCRRCHVMRKTTFGSPYPPQP